MPALYSTGSLNLEALGWRPSLSDESDVRLRGRQREREKHWLCFFNFRHQSFVGLFLCTCLVTQSCLTLCDPKDYGPPGSSVRGIFQARILEWVAISSSRRSSWLRDQTCISYFSCIGWFLYPWATWEVLGFSLLVQWCNCGHGSLSQDAFLLLPLLVFHFGFPGDDADCHRLSCLTQKREFFWTKL